MNMTNRQNNKLSLIEDLPNELFVGIFSCLTGIDAVRAFSSLNKRFQKLLRRYCIAFDFKSKGKHEFDTIFNEHSTKNWKSFQLSNDDDTFGQIEYCFERYPLSVYFTQLKSLSLLKMRFVDESVLFQLSSLTNLISLKIESVCAQIISTIDFSNLKRLVVRSCLNTIWTNNFQQLESLEYTITNCCSDQTNLKWPSKLRHLKIIIESADHNSLVFQSLTNLSGLISLGIYQKETGYSSPNGQVWQDLIRSSFPLLKKFRFYFKFPYWSNTLDEIEQIITSFSTPFYINEKNWFVRGDVWSQNRRAELYSLPYICDRLKISTNSFDEKISSCSNDVKNNMKPLANCDRYFHETSILQLICNDYFNSIKRLHFLPISYHRETSENMKMVSKQFYTLLRNTPHLYSLSIQIDQLEILTNNWTNISVCNQLSRKIRSLKLFRDVESSQCFSGNALEQIIRVFTLKCRHLSVCIWSPVDTVISLLRDMHHLYSLHVPVQVKKDEKITMKWLEQQDIGLNYSNCHLVNQQNNCYFWLGTY